MCKEVIILLFILASVPAFGQTYKDQYVNSVILKSDPSASDSLLIISPATGLDTLFLPLAAPTNNQYLGVATNGQLEWRTISSSSSPANPVNSVQYNDSGTFGGSTDLIYDQARNSLFVATPASNDTNSIVTPNMIVGKDGASGVLYLRSNSSTEAYLGVTPRATQSQDITFEMPAVNGTNLQALVTNGSGVLSWGGNVSVGPASSDNTNNNNNVGNSATAAYIGGGQNNDIWNSATNVGVYGGDDNDVNNNSNGGVIIGGTGNDLNNSNSYSFLFGGESIDINNNAVSSGVAGGDDNNINNTTRYSVILGGTTNNTNNNSDDVVIFAGVDNDFNNSADRGITMAGRGMGIQGDHNASVGGYDHTYSNSVNRTIMFGGDAHQSQGSGTALVGGIDNSIYSDNYAIILAGTNNTINHRYATVLFGRDNDIYNNGEATIAGGRDIQSSDDGQILIGRRLSGYNGDRRSILFGDANNNNLTTSDQYEWRNRFSNGYRLYTDSSLTTGVLMNANQSSWSSISDSSKKHFILELNYENSIESIVELPIYAWNYKGSDKSIRNYSPMAQDFFRFFGEDEIGQIGTDRTISELDLSSILLTGMISAQTEIEYTSQKIKSFGRTNLIKDNISQIRRRMSN